MLTYYCNIKMPIIPKTINRSNAMLMLFWQIPIKIPIAFFLKIEKKCFAWNHERPSIIKAIFGKKNKATGITLSDFKVYYRNLQSCVGNQSRNSTSPEIQAEIQNFCSPEIQAVLCQELGQRPMCFLLFHNSLLLAGFQDGKISSVRINKWIQYSYQISRSVVSDSLRPHESQHARPPCPSSTPRVHSDSCPSSQWCHPAISSSVIFFSSCL